MHHFKNTFMKKFLTIIILIFFVASGCKKTFLDSVPATQLSDASFWQTNMDATAGISAIYNQMQNNTYIYGWQLFTDAITPSAWSWSDAGIGYQAIAKGNAAPALAGVIAGKWTACYKGIYLANLAIKNIPGINMDAALKARLLGEARFLRALFYYNLVDVYGGVPLVTDILDLKSPQPARSSKADVINYITSECTAAAAALPASYTGTDIGRATKGAALTLQAKAYLLINDFAHTASVCQQIMGMNYKLYNDYAAMFTQVSAENNAEVIFDVQYAGPGLGEGSVIDGRFAPLSSYSKGFNSVFPTQDLVDSYEMTNGKAITDPTSGYNPANPYANRDPRLDYSIVRPGSSWMGIPYANIQIQGGASTYLGYLFRKQCLTVSGFLTGDSPLNFIVFRYADVLLMYAEAKNEVSGPDNTVYDAIDQVRARPGVNMPAIPTGQTQASLRDIIRHERKIEFAFEGSYYTDIRRWGIAKSLLDGEVIKSITGAQLDVRHFSDAFNLWPIPQTEIDLNPSLVQNPGY